MTVTIQELERASTRYAARLHKSLSEATRAGSRSAFLCHSHRDEVLVKGLVVMLEAAGWNVYVDWQDAELPATPSRITAASIKLRISTADFFLFLATTASIASHWCPWEIGYADGVLSNDRILVIPTRSGHSTVGSEYLELYRRIILSQPGPLGVFDPGKTDGVVLSAV